MFTKIAATALVAIAVSPAWAVYKCSGANGSVVFQDAPCAGNGQELRVRPASGAGASAAEQAEKDGSAEAPKKPLTEAQRIEKQISASQQARRKQELEVRLVPEAESAIYRQKQSCDREFKALQAKKALAKNNLAGATWEGSISSEMTAIATRCDTENRELRAASDALKAECKQIGGCK